ncbi:MAG: ribonuclease HII [bacterium]
MGIDEAGRGPVLGPMVVAGVAFDRASDDFFKAYGVKDSKQLSTKKRTEIFSLIEEEASWYKIAVIWPETVDHFVASNGLNNLECDVMAELIDSIGVKTCVYVDSPLKPEVFTRMLYSRSKIQSQINCCFKADTIYPVVSCASILAKVTRDRIIEELKSEFGDFGSGYPADEKTRNFLYNMKEAPFFVRKSWKTFKESQESLF